MLRIMLRPRWVLALLLALAVAAGFAWLGQWQLERAVTSGAVTPHVTETSVPLTALVKPNGPTMEIWDGQRVTVSGHFDRQDYQLLSDRLNRGESGYWVVGHFVVSPDAAGAPPGALAVALGWTKDRSDAEAAVAALSQEPQATGPVTLAGRYLNTEAPVAPEPNDDPHEMTTMSVGALINLWHGLDGGGSEIYGGYLVDGQPPASLATIDSPAPDIPVTVNWLNIFYAAEWAIFAGFAVFFWYRLVKDTWEREQEELAVGAPATATHSQRATLE